MVLIALIILLQSLDLQSITKYLVLNCPLGDKVLRDHLYRFWLVWFQEFAHAHTHTKPCFGLQNYIFKIRGK